MTTIAATFAEALANSTLTVAEALELAEADLAPETEAMIEQAMANQTSASGCISIS